jgi:hypothetical protein
MDNNDRNFGEAEENQLPTLCMEPQHENWRRKSRRTATHEGSFTNDRSI